MSMEFQLRSYKKNNTFSPIHIYGRNLLLALVDYVIQTKLPTENNYKSLTKCFMIPLVVIREEHQKGN